MKENEIVFALKMKMLLLKEDTCTKICQIIKSKIALDSVFTYYTLAKLFKLETVYELSIRKIERCFSMVVEIKTFLHLDFSFVAKILESSELNIHTEIEIFNAVITWLKHNIEERSKYAKQLLLKVRLPLLSEHALKYIIDKILSFSNKNECMSVLKEVIAKKGITFQNNKNRYCSQKKFNILFCGCYDTETLKTVRDLHQFDGSNFDNVKRLPSMTIEREIFKAVCLKGEVYIFCGVDNCGTYLTSVEKYTPSTGL